MENMQEELKEKSWTDIHPDFAKATLGRVMPLPLQKVWENYGINYQEAQQWIAQGFVPNGKEEERITGHWFNLGFAPQEAKFWVDFFSKEQKVINRCIPFLASYAREKGYYQQDKQGIFSEKFNNQKENLWEEYLDWEENVDAQEWLDYFYCSETKSTEELKKFLEEGEKMERETNCFFLVKRWKEKK